MTAIVELQAASEQGAGQDGCATVESSALVTPDIMLITIRPDDAAMSRRVTPGSHLRVIVPLARGPEPRSYSLVDLGHDDGLLRIAVRRDTSGRGGSLWMHSLRAGSRLAIDGPLSDFEPSPGRHPCVLLAGGIGITPILGLARALHARGAEFRVIYTGRSRAVMAFADELEAAHPGRVNIIDTSVSPQLDMASVVASVPPEGTLYVCGPMALLTAVRAAWQGAGRQLAGLRFETFGTSGGLPTVSFPVRIPSRGMQFDVPVGTSFLDALEDAGIGVMYDCLRGECGLCRVKIVAADGPVDHRDVFLSERQKQNNEEMCTCVSRMAGAMVTIEL